MQRYIYKTLLSPLTEHFYKNKCNLIGYLSYLILLVNQVGGVMGNGKSHLDSIIY